MTPRDINYKLLMLLVVGGICLVLSAGFIWRTQHHLNDRMRTLNQELERAVDYEAGAVRLIELVRFVGRRDTNDEARYTNTREEVRQMSKDRRALVELITLEDPKTAAERLETRISLWLDHTVFNAAGPNKGIGSDDMERRLRGFVLDYRAAVVTEYDLLTQEMAAQPSRILLFTLLTLLFGGLWFFYMIKGIWQPIRQLQERINQQAKTGGRVSAVTVPALTIHVEGLLERLKEAGQAQHVVNSITEGLIIVDPNGKITSANKTIHAMLGYPVGELIGREFAEIYVKVKTVHVQGFFKRKRTFKEEELFKTAEGKVIPVRFSSSFLFDDQMDVMGFLCIAKDITKEKQVEEELVTQNDWFKITLASIGDAVITTDTNGNINFANEAAKSLVDLGKNAGLNQPLAQVLKSLDPQQHTPAQLLVPAELKGTTIHENYVLIGPDKKELMVELTQAPIFSENDELHGAVIVLRDITEIRRTAEELKQAKEGAEGALQVKARFLANMSHEIRTPMNGVIGMTDLLMESNLTAEQREIGEIIRNSGEALLGLLNDILDLSKVEAGKLVLDHVSFDPRSLAEEVADLMSAQAKDKDIDLVLMISHELPLRLFGDPGRLRQILLNLVSNAIKFTSNGEVLLYLKVSARDSRHCTLHCDVKDTGIGFDAETGEKLFQAFTQADAGTTRKFGGTGLGLAICRELCQAMNGKIWAEGAPNQGATFSFEVRLEVDPAVHSEPHPLALSGLRTLLVESNPSNRQALTLQLKRLGCKVGVCDGREIRNTLVDAYLNGKPIMLLIIDNNLEGVEIADLTAQLRADERFANLGVIMVSSVPAHALPEGWGQDIDQFLTKPLKLVQLAEAVTETLGLVAPNEAFPDEGRRPGTQQEYRILVAEDNPVNQKVTVHMLERAGFRCDVADNGHAVLDAVKKGVYHLILMDCQMPGMDGFQATNAIRNLDRFKHLPIVAMTAGVLQGDRERCLAAGMDDYLAKPVRKTDLLDMLKRFLKPN